MAKTLVAVKTIVTQLQMACGPLLPYSTIHQEAQPSSSNCAGHPTCETISSNHTKSTAETKNESYANLATVNSNTLEITERILHLHKIIHQIDMEGEFYAHDQHVHER